ncbi:NmrA family NAD(P)-binding protein [Nocardia tengchongensis]|uniref:NmrA family NAD(P)-binding protein n=1 Tax=Nocardia tengchongensis TaxID=2055889 RepID=UPI0036531B60
MPPNNAGAKAVADLAKELGVAHFVYSSLRGAGQNTGVDYYASKEAIEAYISELELPATVLRPTFFMDNLNGFNRPVPDENGGLVVNLAVRSEIPVSLISTHDIGAFAAIAFDRPEQFIGRIVPLAAGDYLTRRRSPRSSDSTRDCPRAAMWFRWNRSGRSIRTSGRCSRTSTRARTVRSTWRRCAPNTPVCRIWRRGCARSIGSRDGTGSLGRSGRWAGEIRPTWVAGRAVAARGGAKHLLRVARSACACSRSWCRVVARAGPPSLTI